MLLEAVGGRIRGLRVARGWSQRVLCARAGMSPRFLVQLEGGKTNVSLVRLAEVAEALEVSLVSLVAGLGPAADAADRVARAVREMPASAQDRLVAEVCAGPEKLALIGLRGAGKSTLGRAAADALDQPFVELDREVERATGLTLGALFEMHGPEGYRARAREVLRAVLREPGPGIVEIGGSLVLDPPSEELLWAEARVVWLQASPQEHLERVAAQGDSRPASGHRDALGEIESILAAREPTYRRAHLHIDTAVGLEAGVVAVTEAGRQLTAR